MHKLAAFVHNYSSTITITAAAIDADTLPHNQGLSLPMTAASDPTAASNSGPCYVDQALSTPTTVAVDPIADDTMKADPPPGVRDLSMPTIVTVHPTPAVVMEANPPASVRALSTPTTSTVDITVKLLPSP